MPPHKNSRALLNLKGSDHVKALIHMLVICKHAWIRDSAVGRLLYAFQHEFYFDTSSVQNFVECLHGTDQDVQHLFRKVLQQTLDSDFQFGRMRKIQHCMGCGFFSPCPVTFRNVNSNANSLTLDPSPLEEIDVQQWIESSLHRRRECVECKCKTEIRQLNQYETIRYDNYPDILVLLPGDMPKYELHINMEIVLPDTREYFLLGYCTLLDDFLFTVGRVDRNFYNLAKPDTQIDIGSRLQVASPERVEILLYKAKTLKSS